MENENDWPEPEIRHEEEVVVAHRVRVVRAQRICCPEHGVSTQILLDVQGRIAGIPLELTIELDPDSALALADRFQRVVAQADGLLRDWDETYGPES